MTKLEQAVLALQAKGYTPDDIKNAISLLEHEATKNNKRGRKTRSSLNTKRYIQ